MAESLEILEKLSAIDPRNAQAQRDLSESYEHIGDVQLKLGQLREARTSYQESLKISEKLAAIVPGNAQAQRDLLISYEHIGELQLKLGQLREARASYFAPPTQKESPALMPPLQRKCLQPQ